MWLHPNQEEQTQDKVTRRSRFGGAVQIRKTTEQGDTRILPKMYKGWDKAPKGKVPTILTPKGCRTSVRKGQRTPGASSCVPRLCHSIRAQILALWRTGSRVDCQDLHHSGWEGNPHYSASHFHGDEFNTNQRTGIVGDTLMFSWISLGSLTKGYSQATFTFQRLLCSLSLFARNAKKTSKFTDSWGFFFSPQPEDFAFLLILHS